MARLDRLEGERDVDHHQVVEAPVDRARGVRPALAVSAQVEGVDRVAAAAEKRGQPAAGGAVHGAPVEHHAGGEQERRPRRPGRRVAGEVQRPAVGGDQAQGARRRQGRRALAGMARGAVRLQEHGLILSGAARPRPAHSAIGWRCEVPYSPMLVKPMREELTAVGVQELTTAAEVDAFMNEKGGTAMLVVNSVCGCAAGMARPGVRLALSHEPRPDRVATVFAGQDLEATARARSYIADIPPSSPSIAFFKDGELVRFIPRHRIEGRDAQSVASDLVAAFDEFCVAVPAAT